MRILAVLLKQKELLLPFADFLLLLEQISLHLDAFLFLWVSLLPALAKGGVDLLGCGLLRLLGPGGQRTVFIAGLLQKETQTLL